MFVRRRMSSAFEGASVHPLPPGQQQPDVERQPEVDKKLLYHANAAAEKFQKFHSCFDPENMVDEWGASSAFVPMTEDERKEIEASATAAPRHKINWVPTAIVVGCLALFIPSVLFGRWWLCLLPLIIICSVLVASRYIIATRSTWSNLKRTYSTWILVALVTAGIFFCAALSMIGAFDLKGSPVCITFGGVKEKGNTNASQIGTCYWSKLVCLEVQPLAKCPSPAFLLENSILNGNASGCVWNVGSLYTSDLFSNTNNETRHMWCPLYEARQYVQFDMLNIAAIYFILGLIGFAVCGFQTVTVEGIWELHHKASLNPKVFRLWRLMETIVYDITQREYSRFSVKYAGFVMATVSVMYPFVTSPSLTFPRLVEDIHGTVLFAAVVYCVFVFLGLSLFHYFTYQRPHSLYYVMRLRLACLTAFANSIVQRTAEHNTLQPKAMSLREIFSYAGMELINRWENEIFSILPGDESTDNLHNWFKLRQLVLCDILPLSNAVGSASNVALCLVTFPLSFFCLFYVMIGNPALLIAGGFGASSFFFGACMTLAYQVRVVQAAVNMAIEQDLHSQQMDLEFIQSIFPLTEEDGVSLEGVQKSAVKHEISSAGKLLLSSDFDRGIVAISSYIKSDKVYASILGLPLSPTIYALLRGYVGSAALALIARLVLFKSS